MHHPIGNSQTNIRGRNVKSDEEALFEATIDGISKGLRMGMAEIYAQLLSFDKENIENDKPSFAYAFLKHEADKREQGFDEFMDEQSSRLKEYYKYRDSINNLYDVAEKYGYEDSNQ